MCAVEYMCYIAFECMNFCASPKNVSSRRSKHFFPGTKNNKKNSKSEILISVFGRSKSGVEVMLVLEKCGGEKVNLYQPCVALLKCHLPGSPC
jgi:hypothetical protein